MEHLPDRARPPAPGAFPAGLAPYALRAGSPARFDAERRFDRLVDDLLLFHLHADPVHATRLGFHDYDALVPATDSAGIDSVIARYAGFALRIAAISADSVRGRRRSDRAHVATALREVARRGDDAPWRYDPNLYLNLSSDAIRSLWVGESPPLEMRASNIVARVNEIARILANARHNLRSSPPAAIEAAITKSGALADYLSNDLPVLWQPVRDPVLREEFDHHLAQAAGASAEFRHWLRTELLPRANPNASWDAAAEPHARQQIDDAIEALVLPIE